MQTHRKKRLEVIIEAPLMRRVLEQYEKMGVSGYSVLPVIAGSGHDGSWSAEGQIGEAGHMVAIVCIVDPARLDQVLEAAYKVVSRQIGFIAVSDVEVVRSERF